MRQCGEPWTSPQSPIYAAQRHAAETTGWGRLLQCSNPLQSVPEAFDKIFERFYTDRPEHGFGQNSGLGLSISKQIIEAHRGRLWAENRTAVTAAAESGEPTVLGARFTVRLPTL